MSISGLSYGVVRVEEPGSITSLTLQDVGIVMPGGMHLHVDLHTYIVPMYYQLHKHMTDQQNHLLHC